jgi:hypothetical protein
MSGSSLSWVSSLFLGKVRNQEGGGGRGWQDATATGGNGGDQLLWLFSCQGGADVGQDCCFATAILMLAMRAAASNGMSFLFVGEAHPCDAVGLCDGQQGDNLQRGGVTVCLTQGYGVSACDKAPVESKN